MKSLKSLIKKIPKCYWAREVQVKSLPLREGSRHYGNLFENLVINEIFRINEYKGLDLGFYHWRTNHGAEIDIILQRSPYESLVAIEIKSGRQPDLEEKSWLQSFKEENTDSILICLCQTRAAYTKNDIMYTLSKVDCG